MADPFKSKNYETNLNDFKKAIEQGDVIKAGKQYNKTVSVLSGELDGLTDRAEDVAKHVIHSGLGKYKEPIGEKPSGLIGKLVEILKKILKIETATENPMNNFIKNLPTADSQTRIEYTNVLKQIPKFNSQSPDQEETTYAMLSFPSPQNAQTHSTTEPKETTYAKLSFNNEQGIQEASAKKPKPAPRESLKSDQKNETKSTMEKNIPPLPQPRTQKPDVNTSNKSGAANQRSGTKPIVPPKSPKVLEEKSRLLKEKSNSPSTTVNTGGNSVKKMAEQINEKEEKGRQQ